MRSENGPAWNWLGPVGAQSSLEAVQYRRFFASETCGTCQEQFRDLTTCNPSLSYKRGCVVIRVNVWWSINLSVPLYRAAMRILFFSLYLFDNSGFACGFVVFLDLGISRNFWCMWLICVFCIFSSFTLLSIPTTSILDVGQIYLTLEATEDMVMSYIVQF